MATKSTPDQNDPKADNRAEYSVPPIVATVDAAYAGICDDDGFTIPETAEVIESDDSVAS